MDAMRRARDARDRARDARRAHDKKFGRDEPPEFEGRPKVGGGMDGMVTKAAMDAAINDRVAQALRDNDAHHRAVSDALDHVRGKAGKIAMDGSIKGAADVYSRALVVLGVDHAGIRDAVALRRIFDMVPRPGGEARGSGFAHDSAPANGIPKALQDLFGPPVETV